LDVTVRTIVVLTVLVMVNYLGGRYFERFYLSSQTRVELSSRTVNLLKTITNDVKVTLYYDRDDKLYPSIFELIKEYRAINPRISIETVDYLRDITAAQRVKATKLNAKAENNEKNLVIFECEGRTKVAPGNTLAELTIEAVPSETERKYRTKVVAFKGEMMFTSMLLAVVNPKPLMAYFLQNHGEHRIDNADEVTGYMKFASVLRQNYIQPVPLSLLGTNVIPADCNLLVIAGPTDAISESESEKIQRYLSEGGRLLALFNPMEDRTRKCGLERIVAQWGVVAGDGVVRDLDQSERGSDVVVSAFSRHPLVNPVLGSAVQLIMPRPVQASKSDSRDVDAPKVEEVAFTSERSTLAGGQQTPRRYPVIATVENSVRAVVTERGATRILVIGDSMLFGNGMIGKWANDDFAGLAANWLLDRAQLLEGLGPRPVTDFRINMTHSQLRAVQWILLAALPGGILLLGVLVWFGRRK
jgi:hypothetical protein